MSRPEHPSAAPRSAPRWRAVLVLGLLAGLLGMHGLAPAAVAVAAGHGHRSEAAQAVPTLSAPGGCHHRHAGHDGHGGHPGHRASHADQACVADCTVGAPALPDLAPAPLGAAAAQPLTAAAPATTRGARSPPSLAELQLLRI